MPRPRLVTPLAAVVSMVCGCGGGKPPAAPTTGGGATTTALPPGTPAPEEVSLVTGDRVTIAGTHYRPADPATTGCALFVHQLSSTRAEWQPVIDRVRGRAHLLTIDMRGHGASTSSATGTLSWKAFEAADWEQVEHDVGQAADLIAERGGDHRCVVVGASIGSSAVLRFAAAHPDRVRALALLSPGLAYHGLQTPDAARAVHVPVLIVRSQEKGADDAVGALAGIWRDAGDDVDVFEDPGHAHGMKIVAGNPAALDRLVGFVTDHLR